MSKYKVEEAALTPEEENLKYLQNIAKGVLGYGNQVADLFVQKYRAGLEMLYYRGNKENGEPFTIADLQIVTDAMGVQALGLFQDSAALGQFIFTTYPGSINESELRAPVGYTIDTTGTSPRIVWDATAEYPGPEANPSRIDTAAN